MNKIEDVCICERTVPVQAHSYYGTTAYEQVSLGTTRLLMFNTPTSPQCMMMISDHLNPQCSRCGTKEAENYEQSFDGGLICDRCAFIELAGGPESAHHPNCPPVPNDVRRSSRRRDDKAISSSTNTRTSTRRSSRTTASSGRFTIGDLVSIHNLQNRPELNTQWPARDCQSLSCKPGSVRSNPHRDCDRRI